MIDIQMDCIPDATGDLPLVRGPACAAQRLHIRLGTQQGEWRFDTRCGMSWLFSVLGQFGDSAAIRQLIADQIRLDTEVAAIGEFGAEMDREERHLRYTVPVRLTNGAQTSVVV